MMRNAMRLNSADGSELMDVSDLRAEGKSMVVVGTIMGAMPVEAVLTPTELRKVFKLLSLRLIFHVIGMLFRK